MFGQIKEDKAELAGLEFITIRCVYIEAKRGPMLVKFKKKLI